MKICFSMMLLVPLLAVSGMYLAAQRSQTITDAAGRQSSDADAKRGTDHEVIADRLEQWIKSGTDAETILGHLLDVSVPMEKQVAFLRDVADRLEQRQQAAAA